MPARQDVGIVCAPLGVPGTNVPHLRTFKSQSPIGVRRFGIGSPRRVCYGGGEGQIAATSAVLRYTGPVAVVPVGRPRLPAKLRGCAAPLANPAGAVEPT